MKNAKLKYLFLVFALLFFTFSFYGDVLGNQCTVPETGEFCDCGTLEADCRFGVCSCDYPLQVDITATNCTIPLGGSTCTTTVHWSVDLVPEWRHSYGDAYVTKNGVNFGNGWSDTKTDVIPFGNSKVYKFFLYEDGNPKEVGSDRPTASCVSGTTWNGVMCAAPDLTASAASPTSVVAGVATTFTATISNTGNGSTGASFSNFFQIASAPGGGGTITDLAPSTMSTLAAGANATASSPAATLPVGIYSVRACADKTNRNSPGTITESNENNNCGAWADVTVMPIGMPDLTASSVSPTSVQAGVATTFTATISNIGAASTGASFSYFFQSASAPGGGGTLTDVPPSTMSTLAQGASATASFAVAGANVTVGTYSLRVCADKSNRNSTGSIIESNENNNCGAWADVTVTLAGEDDDCTVDTDGDGVPDCTDDCPTVPGPAPTGCPDDGDDGCPPGTHLEGGVCVPDAIPPTVDLIATPNPVFTGDKSALTWTSSSATSCASTNFNTGGAISRSSPGVEVGPLLSTVTFSITCTGPAGSASDTETITVKKKPIFIED